jgi:hypothetical protein
MDFKYFTVILLVSHTAGGHSKIVSSTDNECEKDTYSLDIYNTVTVNNTKTEVFCGMWMLCRNMAQYGTVSVTVVSRSWHIPDDWCNLHCFREHRIINWTKSQVMFLAFRYSPQRHDCQNVVLPSIHVWSLSQADTAPRILPSEDHLNVTIHGLHIDGRPSETSVIYTILNDVMRSVIEKKHILVFVFTMLVL